MPDPITDLLARLIGGDPAATAAVLESAATSLSPPLLVAAALLGEGPDALDRARAVAVTSRDRQLVALGDAYLAGETDRFDVLVREHLSDHPDNVLASWIARRADSAHLTSPQTARKGHHDE